MNTLIFMVINVLLILPIMCIQTFFYSKTIGLNPKWKGLRLVLVILFTSVVMTALNEVAAIVASLLLLAMFLLYPVFFMGGKLKERFLFGMINFALFMFAILFVVLSIVYPGLEIEIDRSWQSMPLIFALIFTVYIVYMVLVLVIVRISTEGKQYIPRKYQTGIVIGFSIILVSFLGVQNIITWFADVEMSRVYAIMTSLVFLIIWLLLYFVFSFICRYFAKTNEATALAIQNDMIERYMLCKQASDERIQVLSHDLRHSLTQWRAFAEEKGDSDALQSISEYEEQLLSSLLINVENDNANAIINQKRWEADQAQIEFLVDGVFHKDLHAIGMRSIRYVAEKYNGTVNYIFENNWFKSTVMLSGYQNLLSDKNLYIRAKTRTGGNE